MVKLSTSIISRLAFGLALGNLFVYALAGLTLQRTHEQYERSARVETRNLARSLGDNVAGILDKINVGLSSVAIEVEQELAQGSINDRKLAPYLEKQKLHILDFEDLWVTDSKGDVWWGTNIPAGPPVNISDREYFQQLKNNGNPQLAISKPVIGRVTKTWSVLVAKRINHPDGSFAGTVLGSLRVVDYFTAMFAPVELGKNGVVSLRGTDMTVYVRYSKEEPAAAKVGSTEMSGESRRALEKNADSGTYMARSALDRIERMFSYQKVAGYPLYIFVGQDTGEIFAPWQREAAMTIGLALLSTIVTLLYTWSSFKRSKTALAAKEAEQQLMAKQQSQLEERVKERTEELSLANERLTAEIVERTRAETELLGEKNLSDAVINSLPGVFYMFDRQGKLLRWNDEFARLAGFTPETAAGHRLLDRVAEDDKEKVRAAVEQAYAEGQSGVNVRIVTTEGIRTFYLKARRLQNGGEQCIVGSGFDITEQERAEEAQRESETRFRTLCDHSPLGIYIIQDGRAIYVNEALGEMFGYDKAELIDGDPLTVIDPLDHARAAENMQLRLAEKDHTPRHEYLGRCRNGEARNVVIYGSTIILGNRPALIGNILDVTERRQAELELRRLNRELHAISHCNQALIRANDEKSLLNEICTIVCQKAGYRMAWVGFAEIDEEKSVRPVAWAGAVEGYLDGAAVSWADTEHGRGPTGTAIRNGQTVYTQDFAIDPRMAPWLGRALQRGYRSSISLPLRDRTNRAFGAFTIYSPEPNAFTTEEIRMLEELTNDMSFGILVLRARTEQQLAEQALRESETKFRAVFENSRDAIGVSLAGKNVYVNPAYLALFGYASADELRDTPLFEQIAPGCREQIRTIALQRAQGGAVPSRYETRGVRTDGTEFDMEVQATTFELNGQLYSLGQLRDITERKQLEQQLRQSQKMEAVGTLAGGVAHDFNNILTVISGFGTMLKMKLPADETLDNYVTQILTASDRAANLTRSLLAFSRKQLMETKEVELNSIVTGLEKILSRLIREDINLMLNLNPAELPIMADPGQIEQVLINLTANARDAISGDGTISIGSGTVELDAGSAKSLGLAEPGQYALITFSDTGMGMTEEIRQRIFEPFFTTKEVDKGTGLGLAICFGIIKQHKGGINCASAPGEGTTFRIYLPLIETQRDEDAAISVAPLVGGSGTILVVEDDEMVRQFVVDLLGEFGYTVIEARDGEEAVTKFAERANEIALCLCDVIMPKKNGWEVLQAIREQHPAARVLFMSGHQPEVYRQQIMTAEGIGFITKPVTPAELLREVREMLAGS
ncbi:MAG: PAS domain S-box protein [Geobacter sp.]|nr:PAS domain S-box protein [Geobacter sp.]